jgi:hypothetical protein
MGFHTLVFTIHLSVGALNPMRGLVKSGTMEAISGDEYWDEGFHVGRLRFLTPTLTLNRWGID